MVGHVMMHVHTCIYIYITPHPPYNALRGGRVRSHHVAGRSTQRLFEGFLIRKGVFITPIVTPHSGDSVRP